MDHVELRARLRALARDEEAMSRRTGLPAGTIRALMAGELVPSLEVRRRLATALGADPGDVQ